MILTVQPATPIITARKDGSGYDVSAPYSGHNIQLQIGNVSLAFDDRNVWRASRDDVDYPGIVMEFMEYADCPVRLDGDDCPKCTSAAETLLFALAADMGFTVSR